MRGVKVLHFLNEQPFFIILCVSQQPMGRKQTFIAVTSVPVARIDRGGTRKENFVAETREKSNHLA